MNSDTLDTFSREFLWKKAAPSTSGEVVECDMIFCTCAPSCLSFREEGNDMTGG